MIEFKNITKVYQFGSNSYKALKRVSFLIEKGEFVGISGASGSGKTSTMNILGLLDHPTSGEYLLRNKNAAYLNPNQRADLFFNYSLYCRD